MKKWTRYVESNVSGLDKLQAEISTLVRDRQADQRTADALTDVIEMLKSQLKKQELTYESLSRVLQEFLGEIGAGKSDPILWPATLRDVAEELRRLRSSLIRPTNASP